MKTNKLLLMAALHFLSMYILMYTMVAELNHIYININKAYMAGVMTAPMLIIEIILMGSMYKDKKNLSYIFGASIALVVALFVFIRQQTLVGNKEFLKSMIPHHSSAILMCNQASITEPEIASLCEDIVKTQKEEISIMEAMLEKY